MGRSVRLFDGSEGLAGSSIVSVENLLNGSVVGQVLAVFFLGSCVVTFLGVQRTESCVRV